jgi:lysyl-tRNA synthetase class 2
MVAAVFLPPLRKEADYFYSFIPLPIRATAAASAIFSGVVMITLARGLKRRKSRARNLAILLLVLNSFNSLTQSITQLILLVLLIIFRKEFYAKSDPSTKWRPLTAFLQMTVVTFFSSIFLLYLRKDNLFYGSTSLLQISKTVLFGFLGIDSGLQFKSERLSDFAAFFLGAMGVFTILVPLWLFFRKITPHTAMSDEDRIILKQLYKHDELQDSVAYFATRYDKSVVWSKNKKAAIAYRVVNGVMLASGDPIGEYSLWPEAIGEFISIAKQYAWTPGVMGATEKGGQVWIEQAKMMAIDIGDEAIIKVKDFTIEGKPMGNIRHMVNRTKRDGYSAMTYKWSDVPIDDQVELIKLAKEWRYGAAERGFSMSMDRFGLAEDDETIITIAKKGEEIKGFIYFMPWATTGWSLDRMQREMGVDPGINELMIVTTVEAAAKVGIENVSLNFAAFRSLFERADKISAGPLIRTMRNLIRFASNWFPVESLYRFNAKFQPEWQTRYVLYPSPTDLPRVGWAAIRAEQFISSFKSKGIRR